LLLRLLLLLSPLLEYLLRRPHHSHGVAASLPQLLLTARAL
jgi:hypothetical protein